MQKEHDFIENQKKIIEVFRELEVETKKLFSRCVRLGWKQRNALVSQVYSNYTKHEQLYAARKKWEEACIIYRVHEKLYGLLRGYRDLYGYFPEYHKMLEQLEGLHQTAIKREEYEIAGILKKWNDKLQLK